MAWRVAASLQVLLAEYNTIHPDRDKSSDGSIGDALHASRSSDHNPWVIDSKGVGVVRARDFDGGPDMTNPFAVTLVPGLLRAARAGHPALDDDGAYVISNGVIWTHKKGWQAAAYTGSNDHSHHTHVSVGIAQASYDSTQSWGLDTTTTEDDSMSAADVAALGARLDQIVTWMDLNFHAISQQQEQNRNLLAGFTADTVKAAVADIPGVNQEKVNAAVTSAVAAAVGASYDVSLTPKPEA